MVYIKRVLILNAIISIAVSVTLGTGLGQTEGFFSVFLGMFTLNLMVALILGLIVAFLIRMVKGLKFEPLLWKWGWRMLVFVAVVNIGIMIPMIKYFTEK